MLCKIPTSLPSILPTRSKGFLWLGGRDLQYGEWSQAGAVASLECGGIWLGCAMEEAQPKESEAFIKDMKVGVASGMVDR